MTWTPPFQLKWQMDRSSFTNEAAVISKFILKLQAMGWKAFYNAHFTVSLPSSGSFEHLLTVIYGKRAWSWVSSFFLGACSTEKLLWNKKWKKFQENTIWRFSVWLPCSFTKTYSAPDIYLGIGQILSQQVFNITLFNRILIVIYFLTLFHVWPQLVLVFYITSFLAGALDLKCWDFNFLCKSKL